MFQVCNNDRSNSQFRFTPQSYKQFIVLWSTRVWSLVYIILLLVNNNVHRPLLCALEVMMPALQGALGFTSDLYFNIMDFTRPYESFILVALRAVTLFSFLRCDLNTSTFVKFYFQITHITNYEKELTIFNSYATFEIYSDFVF